MTADGKIHFPGCPCPQCSPSRKEPVIYGYSAGPLESVSSGGVDSVAVFLLRRLRRPHVVGGRRDMDLVIVEGDWYRDVMELLNRLDVESR
jgi:hypothetical protein